MTLPGARVPPEDPVTMVRHLLEKQRVVQTMVHKEDPTPKHDLVESLIQRQHLAELRSKLAPVHAADVAHVLEVLPNDDRLLVWKQVGESRGGEILLEVSSTVRQNLIRSMSTTELASVLGQLDADDLADIADDVPPEILQQRLNSLNEEAQNWVRSALAYEADSVGALMTSEMVTVRNTETLSNVASTLRALKKLPVHCDKLFVTDRRNQFVGVLPIQSILLNDPDQTVGEVMATEVVRFVPEDSAHEAAQAFEKYDLASAPVLNQRSKIVGRLTVDTMVDYIREKSAGEVLSMAGLRGEEDLFAPIRDSARNRALWLAVNLVTAFVASSIIGMFEGTIEKLVALAALMPIVASLAGNTGNQTTALIIRGLSHGQVTAENTLYLVRKELGVTLLNGTLLASAVGIFAWLMYGTAMLAAVLAAAVVSNLLIAALVGLAVPLALQRLGRDPAIGSSVVLTATTDCLGFLIFLGLASLFLL